MDAFGQDNLNLDVLSGTTWIGGTKGICAPTPCSQSSKLIHLLVHTRDAITARQWCQLGPIQSWWLRIVCGNIINIIWQGQGRYSRTARANKLKSVFGQRVYFSTRADCDDGSDEMVCTRTCLVEEFTCKNGLCIQVKRIVSLPENLHFQTCNFWQFYIFVDVKV